MTGTDLMSKPTKAQIELAYSAIMGDAELPQSNDPEVVSRAIMERILRAETFEEAFKPQELEGWREYLGVPVLVRSFHLNPSGFAAEGGAPVYAVVDLTLGENGEAVTVTCGGRNVLMQLVKALEKGWLDKPVKLVAKKTNADHGGSALWLEAA
jgi:hypothetical protein